MNILILGGTVFVGRHLVDVALARGHQVTLFNRGQHNPDLFPEVEKLRGDRDGNLQALAGRQWDAVIDTCGYVPRIVAQSAALLADQVAQYVFISTISVYADFSPPGINEEAPVGHLADPSTEEITGESYGPLKVLCEKAVEAALPGRSLIIRPGLIVGPDDPTDRFTYWPVRVARGGEVLAPGNPAQQVQFIDVRDLAAWTIEMVERNLQGVYNATGPANPLTITQLLESCQATTESDANFTWVTEEFLLAQAVGAFVEAPLWVPAEMAGLEQVDCRKAINAGLRFRALPQTVLDTLQWHQTRPLSHTWRAGLSVERETALLAAWHAQG